MGGLNIMTKKQLNLREIKKLGKEYKEQKTVEFGDYTFKVDVKFSNYKIQQLIKDMIIILNEMKELGIDVNEEIGDILTINNILHVKHFTNIPFPKETKLKDLLSIAEDLINVGLLKVIFEAFDKEELLKVNERYKMTMENFKEVTDLLMDDINSDKIENAIREVVKIENEMDEIKDG